MSNYLRIAGAWLVGLLLLPFAGYTQTDRQALLKKSIQRVIDTSRAQAGIGIMGLDFDDSIAFSGGRRFPMQSVYKLPLAIAVLDGVDKGRFSLTQIINITKASLDTDTWSPMLKDFPKKDINMPLSDVLRYAVSKSDNNACDVLFRLYTGTAAVNSYIHNAGIRGINIAATEAEMKKDWSVQYTNWCEPGAMLHLLRRFYNGKMLSGKSTAFLMHLMTESENSPARIKGLLPANAVVAHKTGTSGTNAQGINAATNDVGIITLPDGPHFALVVFVSDYPGGVARGEHIIAQISRLAWDYFTAK